MNPQNKQALFDATRLVIFIVVTTLATAVLVVAIGNIQFGDTTTYSAKFVDASGLKEGSSVRVAGVQVGSVQSVEIVDRKHALVTFTVSKEVSVTRATHAAIRYRNLIGQRYIDLTTEIGDTRELEPGSTIPISRTSPALDLTVLFNGFRPLFEAISPADINQLAYEILQVFQGQGGRLESLLAHTASLTRTLANRDQLINDLIDNLNSVLVNISQRDDQLSRLITNFQQLLTGLKQDRQEILSSLDQISLLAEEAAGLVQKVREPLLTDIENLRRLAGNLDQYRAEIDRALQVLPIKLNKIGRTATYGSFFNFYLCSFQGSIVLPGGTTIAPINYQVTADRCDLG